MNSPEDNFPVEEPHNPALSEEESARQLRDDFCRQYRDKIKTLERIVRDQTDFIDLMRDEFQRIKTLPDFAGRTEIAGICDRAISVIFQNVPVIIQRDEAQKAYESNKACLRRHFDLLQTLLEQFDHYADGAPDATDLGKFCNEMIGLYNEISMSDARTLRGQNISMVAVIREMFDALERAKVGFHGAPPTEKRIDDALALARPFLKNHLQQRE